MTSTPRSHKSDWSIVGLGFVALALTFAARSSVGVLMPTWEAELGWTRATIASGSSLVLATMALTSPLAGNMIDRYGPRIVLASGLAVLGGAIMATAAVTEAWQFLLLFGIVGGCGFGVLSLPLMSAMVMGYFRERRGLATGITLSGSTGGQLPVLTLLAIMVTTLGWRSSYLFYGAMLLGLAAVALVLVRPGRSATEIDTPAPLRARLRLLATSRTFQLLLGAFTLCGFTTAGVVEVHLVPYAVSLGHDLIDSTAAYGVHGVFNMAGIILFGWLTDRMHRPTMLAGIFFARALTFVLLLFIGGDVFMLYLFAALFGLLNFAVFPVISSLVASRYGMGVMGLTVGLLFAGHSLGAAAGALFGGLIYDATGRYVWVWVVAAVLAVAAGLFAIAIRETPDRARADAAAPAAA